MEFILLNMRIYCQIMIPSALTKMQEIQMNINANAEVQGTGHV